MTSRCFAHTLYASKDETVHGVTVATFQMVIVATILITSETGTFVTRGSFRIGMFKHAANVAVGSWSRVEMHPEGLATQD